MSSQKAENEADFGGPKFNPPLYKQRYSFVIEILRDNEITNVADFGCSDAKFFHHAKEVSNVKNLRGIDISRDDVLSRSNVLRPLPFDYIIPLKETPLEISLYVGNITEIDSRMEDIDCVTMIEVIEHLENETLLEFPDTIFKKINPKLVVITTPNSEYNVLFPNFSGFRHWDHKFEWSRKEFQTWCTSVCEKFDYTVEYNGVGDPLPGSENLGFCTQIAIFTRTSKDKEYSIPEDVLPYELVFHSKYPGKRAIDDLDSEILNQATYHIHRIAFDEREEAADESHDQENQENLVNSLEDKDNFFNFKLTKNVFLGYKFNSYYDEDEIFHIKIPLNLLQQLDSIKDLCSTVERLKKILTENDFSIDDEENIQYQLKTYSSSSDEDECSTDEIMNSKSMNHINTDKNHSLHQFELEEDWDIEDTDSVHKNENNLDIYDKTHIFCHYQDNKCQRNLTCMKFEDVYWSPLSAYQEFLLKNDYLFKCACKKVSNVTMDNIDGTNLCKYCLNKKIDETHLDGQFSDVEDAFINFRSL